MTHTTSKTRVIDKLISRLRRKTLFTILVEKFVNEYGYEKGIVAARAFVKDIIETVNKFYVKSNKLQPGQILWLATDKDERHAKGKTLEKTKQRVIKLTLVAQEDIKLLKNRYTNFRDIQRQRAIRLIKEAYKQKAVLTIDDLLILLTTNSTYLSRWIQEYQEKNNEILPIRGNVADIGPGLTHKKQIISLYTRGLLTPEIARLTNHSEKSVDRYITDYERIKLLKEHGFKSEEVSFLVKRGRKVVDQYLKFQHPNLT